MNRIKSFFIALAPFYWIKPRIDRSICDTVVYLGPFRIAWENKP